MGDSAESTFLALLGDLARSPEKPLEPAAELRPGRRVGRYEIVEELGRGGMGAVYRARDEVLGRDVALKVILVGQTGTVDRFRREVAALASVSHPNVISVHDAGVDGALPFVILELVEGQTLRHRLLAGRMSIPEAQRLALDLARGLGAVHAAGVIHRDLKPENILIDRRGTARIVDFGLARLVERPEVPANEQTEAGTLLGTAHYMAPEQVRGERVDARADYFALGAVLYEAIVGRRAFEAPTRADVISAVLRDQPPTDSRLLADEDARRLLGVSLRCLEKQRERRYQTMTELVDAIEHQGPPPLVGSAGAYRAPAEIPETRYARSSGVHIAYQVVSPPGPPTLLAAPPFFSNIEVLWESPWDRAWIQSVASFCHYIHYDKRGVGVSDPIAPECTFEERIEDLRAVLDAEKIERAFLLGVSEGGPLSIGFAARHPERVQGLVLMDSFARLVKRDDYPHGLEREQYQGFIDKFVERWGTPQTMSTLFVKSREGDAEFLRWGNRYERQCASPGTIRRMFNMQLEIDVRPLLDQIRCPVLVVHRSGDPLINVEHGRYLATHIPGARYVEIEGRDHAPWHGDAETPMRLLREFLVSPSPTPPAR